MPEAALTCAKHRQADEEQHLPWLNAVEGRRIADPLFEVPDEVDEDDGTILAPFLGDAVELCRLSAAEATQDHEALVSAHRARELASDLLGRAVLALDPPRAIEGRLLGVEALVELCPDLLLRRL